MTRRIEVIINQPSAAEEDAYRQRAASAQMLLNACRRCGTQFPDVRARHVCRRCGRRQA